MRALLAVLAVALLVTPAYAAKPADKGQPPKGEKDRAVAVEHHDDSHGHDAVHGQQAPAAA